jgi:hypothetical protein
MEMGVAWVFLHLALTHTVAAARAPEAAAAAAARAPGAAAAAAARAREAGGGAPCKTALDCQLNGVCAAGRCVCDPAWKTANCSVLNLLPAKPGQGYGQRGSSVSSWGGGVIRDPVSSKYYMHVAEMVNNCGLGMWGVNSRCVLAEAGTAGGPYTRVATVVDAWCHGPSLGLDPATGTWLFGHMGDGTKPRSKTPPGCRVCRDGTTASGNSTLYPCPKAAEAVDTPFALTASHPTGPWQQAAYIENGANSEPFFLPNGTLFFVGGGGFFGGITRYESLAHALAGRGNGTAWGPTRTVLGGTNDTVSSDAVHWEDPTLWVDKRGHFHVLAHAWRGQDEDWPAPGCHKSQNVSWNEPPFWRMTWPGPCTSNGGHAYSVDGREWNISPVPPYTAETEFEDGSTVFWRARERPHVVFNEHGELAYLLNGVGDPISVNCTNGRSTPGRVPTDPTACQCPDSEFYHCPPQTGGENIGGPGGDHTFTLLQGIATASMIETGADDNADDARPASAVAATAGVAR